MTLQANSNNGSALSTQSIERLQPMLTNFLGRRLRKPDVEDVLQETFLNILERTAKAPIINIDAYAFRVASNEISRHFRRRAKQNDLEKWLFEFSPGENSVTPYQVISGRDEIIALMESIECLPDRTRSIFRLNRCMDMTYSEISGQLKISVSAVEKHMMKALHQLSDVRVENF